MRNVLARKGAPYWIAVRSALRAGRGSTAVPIVATSPPALTAKPQLRFGHRRVAPEDVRGHSLCIQRDRGRSGSFALALASTLGTLVFSIGVIEHGWRTRFWVGAAVCALIGLSALEDILWAKPIERYRFDVRLASGESFSYVTTDRGETARLDAQLRLANA